MRMHYIMFALLIVVPFVTGIIAILGRLAIRGPRIRLAALWVGICCLTGSVFFYVSGGPYLWALHLEDKWREAEPKTKLEMESYLSFYSQREIGFDTSGWGSTHPVKSGERMVRYSILYAASLDVVYTDEDRLVAIYTTYE